MSGEDIFWRLENADLICSQEGFYGTLHQNGIVKNVIYMPDELSQEHLMGTARIVNKTFTLVSFSKTKMKDLIFRNCVFDRCQFIGSSIISCEFHNCQFVSTNTHKVSISSTYIDPQSFANCLDRQKHQNIGAHLFHMLLKNSRDEDQKEFERAAQFMFLKWQRYEDLYKISEMFNKKGSIGRLFQIQLVMLCLTWGRGWLWEKLFGSGVRIRNFIGTTIATILLFSLINWCFRNEFGLSKDDSLIGNYVDSIYFTIISLTTLGYGDFVPTTTSGRLFAAFQSVVGFCLFALLASMLFRRVTR